MMRRFLAITVAGLLAWAPVPFAIAQTAERSVDFSSEGAAYSACMADSKVALEQAKVANPSYASMYDQPTCPKVVGPNPYFDCSVSNRWSDGLRYLCQGNTKRYYRFPADKQCSAQPDLVNARLEGKAGGCSGGCAYAPVLGGGETYRITTIKGVNFTHATRLGPTGEACTVSTEAPEPTTGNEDQCVQDTTLTQCVKKDGSLCTKSSTGKQFCWSPGESGIKTSGNEAASNVPEGKEAKVPPVAPKNGGEWEKVGDASVSISETKNGSTTTSNSTINNYNSSYGSSGSGASGNGASGQSNGGSGDGSGSGSDGDGDDDGDGAGSTAPIDELYKKSEKTVDSVMSDFYSKVQAAPMMGGISSFMTVPGGGSCPVFSLSASRYWQAMSYDGHCSGSFLGFLRAAGYVILAIASYFAFRIAVT